MWIFYYKSEERISQIAYGIDPNIPVEKNIKKSRGGNLKVVLDAKTLKLMDLLGFQSKCNLNAEGNIDNQTEIKYKILDETIIDRVCTHLSNVENYTYLSNDSNYFAPKDIKKLVKFKGKFHPQITGNNPREKMVEIESRKSLTWKCIYKKSFLVITTSIESVISKTPLYSCIENENVGLEFEGYGTFEDKTENSEIVIIPLFFGVNLDI